jgi:pyruvate dehydrogenase E1 component
MVVRANKEKDAGGGNVGGHIATFASAATLYEVGFNHFFRARNEHSSGDQVYFQGHASPGPYARAFVEGRLTEQNLINFRRELEPGGGLSSYPHPWLMPGFWQFPTVSMGLGPICSIYQARFNRYLEHRGLKNTSDSHVWAFLGDGECDEAETLGAITLASREKLDNLIWVVNCNLQRLDGPVRGNGKIIRELEGIFRGAGWHVIKVIWGEDWDPLIEADETGDLVRRMGEVVDGQYQKYTVETGAYARNHFFNTQRLQQLAEHLTDADIVNLRRGGHDPVKVYAAYKAAAEHKGQPTVILAKTVKGYGMGEAGEGQMIAHQQKKLGDHALKSFRDRLQVPISDEEVAKIPFLTLPGESEAMIYLKERRAALGGSLPARRRTSTPLEIPPLSAFDALLHATAEGREISTTMAFVRILTTLLRDKAIGSRVVPIVPDESRTFGMEGLFRQIGIFSQEGQRYRPQDADQLMYYREDPKGQILQEGINEPGAMASFIAAGTSYSTSNTPMIPFYVYYSMFGFQRVGDLVWAFADSRGKGFLVGGTAGRTTLLGEGLQHDDGHSHVLSSVVPTCKSYDPAWAYEIAVIVQDGIRRMYENNEDHFYYLTVCNENYAHPAMPNAPHIQEGILRGIYRYQPSTAGEAQINLFGSGPILNEALKAQTILQDKYGVAADVWSVTSYTELRRDALAIERWNRLHPAETPRTPYVVEALGNQDIPIVAATDYMKIVADQIAPWLPGRLTALGTDGFSRSENREHLRRHFEVDAASIAAAALSKLAAWQRFDAQKAHQAILDLGIDPDKIDAAIA